MLHEQLGQRFLCLHYTNGLINCILNKKSQKEYCFVSHVNAPNAISHQKSRLRDIFSQKLSLRHIYLLVKC